MSGLFPVATFPQDNGSLEREFHGKGVEVTVNVLAGSGQPISTPAIVKLYRDGTNPSGQAETSRGQAVFVVNNLGEFTVIVRAAGYADAQKDISILATGHAQVDVYLRPAGSSNNASPPPGRPLLAPRAQEAFDKAVQALSADKLDDAQKFARKAAQLAPSHPDVLYLEGLLLMKQRNWTQAQLSLEKATQIDPSHSPAFAALGMTLCNQGKFDAAIEPLEKSLQLDQSSQSQKSPHMEKSARSDTLSQPEAAPQSAAGAWQTRWSLAQAYYHREQYDQALQMSQQALASSQGKAPEIALLVAQSLTAVGRYEDAAQTLRDFLRDHPKQSQAPTAQRWLTRLSASGKINFNASDTSPN